MDCAETTSSHHLRGHRHLPSSAASGAQQGRLAGCEDLAEATGRSVKTDPVDAAMLTPQTQQT
jgi:hypothetical protein